MDLPSAVQFLLSYEASLKLKPGQKPPPPSPSLFAQLSEAVAAVDKEFRIKKPCLRFSSLPPSVWSDWPLCCGVDLTPKELKAARSLPPSLLRDRGLLSLFLALHSCAQVGVGSASFLGHGLLVTMLRFQNGKEDDCDPAPFPSAHLAARVGHRLINADDTLDFHVDKYSASEKVFAMFDSCIWAAINILISATSRPDSLVSAVPHEAAGLSLAKETAVMLDALCAAERSPEEGRNTRVRGLCNQLYKLPLLISCKLFNLLFYILGEMQTAGAGERGFMPDVFWEAAALPAYDPVLLLQLFYRDVESGFGRRFIRSDELPSFLESCRGFLWMPLSESSFLARLRHAGAYTAFRLGLEDLGRQGPGEETWLFPFTEFAVFALHSGLVQPELILRARPQLLEGLVEGLARGRIRGPIAFNGMRLTLSLMARSPAVSFHLRKFFSRSGCLQYVQEVSDYHDRRWQLIRLLGPRAAQSGVDFVGDVPLLLKAIAAAKGKMQEVTEALEPSLLATICDFVIRDLTLDMLREPRLSQPMLQYLSELAEEIAAPKHPHSTAQYGVLLVVGLGKACLALSKLVSRALKEIREAGPKGKGARGSGGAGATRGVDQKGFRASLVGTARELSSLRRRVLRELLPLAEAREAALWEGVREEEVVAALALERNV